MPCGAEGLLSGTPAGIPDLYVVKDREPLISGVGQRQPTGAKGLGGLVSATSQTSMCLQVSLGLPSHTYVPYLWLVPIRIHFLQRAVQPSDFSAWGKARVL